MQINFFNWFDPHNTEHIEAYVGWVGGIPKDVVMPQITNILREIRLS